MGKNKRTLFQRNLYEATLESKHNVRSHVQHSRRSKLFMKETGVAPASMERGHPTGRRAADRPLRHELSENKQPPQTEASRHPPFTPTATR